ncbi:hypothetical protein COY32_00185 [candidate division WWE3 bacterium CG_4_10_14_0_2_um_filter_41_14]|uniref:Gram-positive cocci surface proteins LPxTG domain-containing protein n=1 Tax=candidate division WWE3 bacterium CG_4_10_14_0_2_um_filter_41_14 TaxID=1975072 RepID=A0A2M7TM75_UNCKA|nr:MAG: hypothetical protein COY32_00185 [candidate division WWE3 bacterium CG_4_10_14_0_2_um_filter_41_14]
MDEKELPANDTSGEVSDEDVETLLSDLDTEFSTEQQDPSNAQDAVGEEVADADTVSGFDPNSELSAATNIDKTTSVEPQLEEEIPTPQPNTDDEVPTPTPASPENKNDNNKRNIIALVVITGILLIILAVTVWWFFLRDGSSSTTPTPTPTPSIQAVNPTATPGTQTHLECRFGLCVEVPGAGENVCSSSFDCEQNGSQLTPTPTTGEATPLVTVLPTATAVPTVTTTTITPTAQTTVQPTVTPTRAVTTTPQTTSTTTATPTPLASQLPESGTVSTTIFVSLLSLLFMSAGFVALRKQD